LWPEPRAALNQNFLFGFKNTPKYFQPHVSVISDFRRETKQLTIAADVPKHFPLNRLSYQIYMDKTPEGVEK
jgi:hypothetical protein